MEKLDLTKRYKRYYTAGTKPELVEIEPAQFISITGKGDPSEAPFAECIQALYSVAYAIKFAYKLREQDFTVAKLEGQWWYDERKYPNKTIYEATQIPRSEWEYRSLIRMPEYVEKIEVQRAIEVVVFKRTLELARSVELFTMEEGKCVQMMHVGPFATESGTIQQIAAFCETNGLAKNGLHHEIYLSDFRKTVPENLRTILREPVK